MSGRVTLRTIADDLGVTVATVSMALRAHPRISAPTRMRVLNAAERLGYIYNRAAANLRQTQSSLVAVCVSDLTNPVFNEFLIHIEQELRAVGRQVFLGIAREDPVIQRQFLQTSLEQGVSAIMLLPVHGTTRAHLTGLWPLERAAPLVPTVLVSRGLDDVALPQFVNDDHQAGALAARCLIDHGHRHLAWVGGGQATSTARDRLGGALATIRAAGLPPPRILHGPTARAFGHDTAQRLLADPAPDRPTGAICFSDLIAFGMVAGIMQAGRTPARDLSVIGCDDMEEARLTYPALTTIAVDKVALSRQAARALFDPAVPPGRLRFSPRLVLRATVGQPAG